MFDELIKKRYELAISKEYEEIRKAQLDCIVKWSCTPISPEKIQGMLLLINETDDWINDYNSYIKKQKERKNKE